MPLDASSSPDHRRQLLAMNGSVRVDVTVTEAEGSGDRAGGELVLARSGEAGALHELMDGFEQLRTEAPYDDATFQLVADRPTETLDHLAEHLAGGLGLGHRRELFQLRRALPVEPDHRERTRAPEVTLRPIRLGDLDDEDIQGDVGAWLRVNNRAFAGHPDQGQETAASLLRRIDGEDRDPSGFLVLDDRRRPGELAGFCWTKVHAATDDDPELGEIYVIGVDPSRHGEGLGTSLVLAGLDHLAAAGVGTGMLYVEADNDPARRLYDRLGFTVHLRRRVYSAVIT